jgi:hypothetical protein
MALGLSCARDEAFPMTHAAEVERILAHAQEYLRPRKLIDADFLTGWCKGCVGFPPLQVAHVCVDYFELDAPQPMFADLLVRLGWNVARPSTRIAIVRNALNVFGVRTKQARP